MSDMSDVITTEGFMNGGREQSMCEKECGKCLCGIGERREMGWDSTDGQGETAMRLKVGSSLVLKLAVATFLAGLFCTR